MPRKVAGRDTELRSGERSIAGKRGRTKRNKEREREREREREKDGTRKRTSWELSFRFSAKLAAG